MKSGLTLIPQNYDREMRYYKKEEGRVGEREREIELWSSGFHPRNSRLSYSLKINQ